MFITFEGSEGSGKSTQIQLLNRHLVDQGYPVLMTREPGGTRIGEQVRECLHDLNNREMTAEAEVLLYSASRVQLVTERIRPALENGYVVISDRYADSTIAYQGYGRLLDLDKLKVITAFATGGLTPDLTFYFDIDVEQGLQRRSTGGGEINRMDLQSVPFYERVRRGYLDLATKQPNRWVIVDANRDKESINMEICRIVDARLDKVRDEIT